MGARETALNALIACRKSGAWSNGVLKEYISRDRLDGRDAALASRLCSGVLQNRLKLDFYLKQLLTGKLRDLHPILRDILHLGLYQLLEMDRIPDAAAVNESVGLAKKYCKKLRSAPGLVNAVLRSAVRGREELKAPRGWQEIYAPTLIRYAAECAYGKQIPLRYMDRLLEKWQKMGVRTPEEAKAQHQAVAGAAAAASSNPALNYQQRSNTEQDYEGLLIDLNGGGNQ